jgi:hypothetical protein
MRGDPRQHGFQSSLGMLYVAKETSLFLPHLAHSALYENIVRGKGHCLTHRSTRLLAPPSQSERPSRWENNVGSGGLDGQKKEGHLLRQGRL